MQAPPKILVIDDDSNVRDTITMMLEEGAYEIREASDGEKGLRVMEAFEPDVVITDIIMPEMEGIETITEIRKRWPECRIIAISGGGRTRNLDFLEIASKIGASDVIAKPFNVDKLLSTVQRVLDGRASTRT